MKKILFTLALFFIINLNLVALTMKEKIQQDLSKVGVNQEIIDKIDDNLAKVYALTKNELSYIKNFAIRYRKGEKD